MTRGADWLLPDNHQHKDIEKALMSVSSRSLAVDVGAHRGIITKLLSRHFHRVVAFEPGPLGDQIEPPAVVHRCALGSYDGEVSMRDGGENSGQRHVIPGAGVQLKTLDSFGLTPDFIKIDVEGMEVRVLLGATETLTRARPVVMLEDNGLSVRYGIPRGAAGDVMKRLGAVMLTRLNKNDELWGWK